MTYLIRHPQSLANIQRINGPLDGDITDKGRWQIERTAKKNGNSRSQEGSLKSSSKVC